MKREEVHHLLGGYAAGTLTPAEQQILFAAAMEDQELFDALADEQSLKELLDDPEARGYLRAALAEQASSRNTWWPKAAGLCAIAAMLIVVTVVGIRQTTGEKQNAAVVASKQTEVTQNTPAPQPDAGVVAAPVPPQRRAVAKSEVAEKDARPIAKLPAKAREPEQAKLKKEGPALVSETAALPESKAADKKVEVASAPVPLVRAEPREQELAKTSGPATIALSSRTAPLTQLSASQLFLTQYRQNFSATELSSGGGQAFGQLRDNVQRKRQEQQQTQDPSNRATPEDRSNNQRATLPASPVPGGIAINASQTPPVTNRGIRYQILRRNSRGQFIQTRLDTRFEAGDEIQLQVEKNAPGVVTVLSGSSVVTLTTQSPTSAQTAPMRLAAGAMELSIVFAEAPAVPTAAPAASQLAEQSGNLMYVVLPGALPNPVVATYRITVY